MGLLRNLAIGILTISFFTFVAFFGSLPALRRTPIGWLQRALCVHAPNGLRRVDKVLTGGKVARRCTYLGQYLFYERNPVVLVC
jgi:palmitoyltransferase